jgi:hypothetical protein
MVLFVSYEELRDKLLLDDWVVMRRAGCFGVIRLELDDRVRGI